MIHILDYKTATFDYNPDIMLQYVDLPRIFQKVISETDFVKKQLEIQGGVFYQIIEDAERPSIEDFYQYIENNDVSLLICNIEIFKNCYLDPNFYFEKISKKYPNVKFIVLSDETFFKYSNLEYNQKNVFYILNSIYNPYSFVENINNIPNLASYYIMNDYLQEEYVDFLPKLFHTSNDVVRDKKYNFYNGVHKPHRLKCYELIKKYDLLDEGYFSYADFASMSKNDEFTYEFIEFFGFKNKREYEEYLSKFEIPLFYDTLDSDPNVFVAFANPPQTSLQSYISITTETIFQSGQRESDLVLSEKSFKPFYGFNIPLIVGAPLSIEYLRDLGFDLFDDFFDNSKVSTKAEIFNQFSKNIKKIKEISKIDLHKFYMDNSHRLSYNFEILTKTIKEKDIYNLNSFLNE